MIFDNCKWIAGDNTCQAPIFRREFQINQIASAKISICGLGFFELYLNGAKVSEDMLVPVFSNYEPRLDRRMIYPITDEMSYRIYYCEYDITNQLHEGKNALGVALGNGWYNQLKRTIEGDFEFGLPKLCFVIELIDTNGTSSYIKSNEALKWCESEIIENNLFYGETHDLRKLDKLYRNNIGFSEVSFDDSNWDFAKVTNPPNCEKFELQTCPADKIIRTIKPILIYEDNRRRIFDCGENISGFVVIRSAAKNNETITIRHSEEIKENQLDFDSAGGNEQIQTDTYICSDMPHVCHPKFCWHGFRYFEITGDCEVVEVAVVHSDIAVTSSFECSNETLNWIYNAYIRSQLTNIHCGVPSDCPHRERLGYTGDGQITAKSAMLALDIRSLYDKWLDDIADCQDIHNGHIQHTAPFYGGGGGPGGWGGAIYIIPYSYYLHYGDKSILEKYYKNMRLWLDYMESRTENGIVTTEEKDGWCLGDWCTPERIQIPEAFVNTYYYIEGMITVIKISEILNLPNDEILAKRLEKSRTAITDTYFDKSAHSFCGGVNGADAFGLSLGLGDEKTFDILLEKYTKEQKLDTGIFGTEILINLLFERGCADLAFLLLTNSTELSFDAMRLAGATTIWEHWNGGGSHNHPMFGGIIRAFFTHILGIKQSPDSIGFSSVSVSPANIKGLSWAKGHITTPNGKIIKVSYQNNDGQGMVVDSNID